MAQWSYMDDGLYQAACQRGVDFPHINDEDRLLRLTPVDKNNVLHVAAQHGNTPNFIGAALLVFPTCHFHLLCGKNAIGETPLHLAAQFGDMDTVEALLNAHDVGNGFPLADPQQMIPCWIQTDNQGDTPLHKALRYGHQNIALLLLERDPRRVFASLVNNSGESPAYLAAESFCIGFLNNILDAQLYSDNNVSFSGSFGQTVFHPARKLPVEAMLILIERRTQLLGIQDNTGKTVVHYAVEENRETMVKTLLRADTSLAYLRDNEGLTPLHVAAKLGFSRMIRTFLDLSPQSLMIRTGDQHNGQTALHVTKMRQRSLNELLRNTRMKELINQADNDGNTPLHLALINSDLGIAYTLLMVNGINWRLRNNSGYTPMDLCRSNHKIPSHMLQIYLALRDLEVREHELGRRNTMGLFVSRFFPLRSLFSIDMESMTEEELGHMLNNIAVAAALIVTVTFAAPFTAPGGYNDKTGGAKLGNLPIFRLFIISDMVAMLASITVLFQYTFGIGKRVNRRLLARVSIVLLQLSLYATIFAFLSGVVSIFPHTQGWVGLGAFLLTGGILMLQWILIIQYVSLTGFFN